MDNENKSEEYVLVPSSQLSKEAIHGLVEEFVLREGTDYGHSEASLDDKRNQVLKQLENGYLHIAYNITEESCTLIRSDKQ